MTVISCFKSRNVPCLLGDIMISSSFKPTKKVTLPASGQESSKTPIRWETHYFTGFVQKLNVISPHMVVGWAGSLMEAKTVIKEIRKQYEIIDPTDFEQLDSVSQCITKIGFKNLDMMILISNDTKRSLRVFGNDIKKFKTSWGEEAIAVGTGEDHVKELLNSKLKVSFIDNYEHALHHLISIGAKMWHWDITGEGPFLAFGGGYELAILKNNRIEKITNVLYINISISSKKVISMIPIFKKVDYWNSIQVIRILEIEQPSTDKTYFDIKRSQYILIPPADFKWESCPSGEEILSQIPDMNASYFPVHIRYYSSSSTSSYRSFAFSISTYKPVEFYYDDTSNLPTSYAFNPEFLDEINFRINKV